MLVMQRFHLPHICFQLFHICRSALKLFRLFGYSVKIKLRHRYASAYSYGAALFCVISRILDIQGSARFLVNRPKLGYIDNVHAYFKRSYRFGYRT